MANAKSKALKKKMADGEREAIRDYSKAITKSEGKDKKIYKHILPEEKEHLKKLT